SIDDLGGGAVDGLGPPAYDRAADDQAVRHRGELADLVRTTDPEPDADRQVRLGPQPADGLDQLRGQALPLAGDPRDRDVVNEAGGRLGDLDGALPGRRRGDELDQLEVAPGRLLDECPGFLDGQVGDDQAVEPGGRRVV